MSRTVAPLSQPAGVAALESMYQAGSKRRAKAHCMYEIAGSTRYCSVIWPVMPQINRQEGVQVGQQRRFSIPERCSLLWHMCVFAVPRAVRCRPQLASPTAFGPLLECIRHLQESVGGMYDASRTLRS